MCEPKYYCVDDLKQVRSEFFNYHKRDKLKQTIKNDRSLQTLDNAGKSSILDFFGNKYVFITGGTGFMGKVLIEKLIRSCTGIHTIYLLMREKKGVNQEERLKQILNIPVFDRLKRESPEALNKIQIICGDCEVLNLGLSVEDRNLLKRTVNIVFHVAASVRFDDSIKKAVLMNTRGTREIISLTKEIINLEVLVHVSTSYANTNKKIVDEIVYSSRADWRSTIRMVESMDDAVLNILQPKILGDSPNTYTFTKALSEDLVNEESENIPLVIFRPSIVVGAHSEPVPGWVDNFNGPTGMIVGGGLGIIHAIYGDENIVADWIEVDIAVNAMIISAWYQAMVFKQTKKSLIINACTSNTNPISFNSLIVNSLKVGKIYPFYRLMWYPFVIMSQNKFIYNINVLLFHILPGLILDILLRLRGEKLSLMRIYRKAYFSNNALAYFMINDWIFKNGHFVSLNNLLKDEERLIFPTDCSSHDVILVLVEDLFGFKKFLLHEDVNDTKIEKARIKLHRLFILQCVVVGTIFLLIATILWSFGKKYHI